jgi:hypothetical protein
MVAVDHDLSGRDRGVDIVILDKDLIRAGFLEVREMPENVIIYR